MEVGSAWLRVVMMRKRRMGRRVAAERSALQAVTPLTEGFAPMSTPWRWLAASRSCESEVMPRRRAAVWASVMRPKAVVRRVGPVPGTVVRKMWLTAGVKALDRR